MTIQELKAQITAKQIRPVYIFTGEELEVMNIYINQIAKVRGQKVFRADDFESVYNANKSSKALNTARYCYVIRDDRRVQELESVQKILDNVGIKEQTLILVYTTLDKRTKFYKRYKDITCEFNVLDASLLKRYIAKHIKLSDKNADKLIEVCEGNYGRILLEIDKIKNYREWTGDVIGYPVVDCIEISDNKMYGVSFDKVFEALLKDGTIHQPPKDAIWDFVNAVMDRQAKKAFKLLQECYASGEATMVLLTGLYTNVRVILQVQSLKEEGEKVTTNGTGLTSWQIKCSYEHINKYTTDELLNLLLLITDCQKAFVTGKIDEQYIMDYILVNTL